MLQLGICSNTTTYCYPVDTWLVPLKLQLRQNLRNTIEDKNIYLYLLVVQDVAIKFLCKANRTPLFWCIVFVLVFWCIWCSGVSARACRRWLRDSLIGAITPTLPKTRRPAGLNSSNRSLGLELEKWNVGLEPNHQFYPNIFGYMFLRIRFVTIQFF